MSETGKLKRIFVFLLLSGFLSGILIEVIICLCTSAEESLFDDRLELVYNLAGSGLYGAVAMGGSIVYHIERWGLLRVTITHFTITLTAFLVTNALLGWFSSDILIIIIILFTVAYMLIWLIMFLLWKRTIRKMNRDLELLIKEDKEDGDQ